MLRAREVGFSYRHRRSRQWIFRSFDWLVAPGAITLLIGPNGAGKSTLLKLLCGFEEPDEGVVTYDGGSGRDVLYSNVGWMPQNIQPALGLTTVEQVEYAAWASGASRPEARRLGAAAVDLTGLRDLSHKKARHLSGGQLRRLGLAQAYVRQAPVLLLDEPTAGLDPAQSNTFLKLLHSVDCPGGIVVSSHQVLDLADHVDRVTVIDAGTIRFNGSAQEFRDFGKLVGVNSGSFAEIFAAMCPGDTR